MGFGCGGYGGCMAAVMAHGGGYGGGKVHSYQSLYCLFC